MASQFHIEVGRFDDRVELRLHGVFDGTSAWELRHAMAELPRELPVVIDFTGVHLIYEFGVGLLAAGYSPRSWPRVELIGVRPAHEPVLRRFGLESLPAPSEALAGPAA